MNKTEIGKFVVKGVLLENTRNEKTFSSSNSFTPKYLNLHCITEASKISGISAEPLNNSSFTTYKDVALISSEGEAFLCNKLFLIR